MSPGAKTVMSPRILTALVIVLAPLLVVVYDVLALLCWGADVTITDVVRGWAEKSPWPEAVYVIGAGLLYLHFFRKWF